MIFTPFKIADLELMNRIIRAGCFEGLCHGGNVTDQLIEHHRRVVAGGAAMTTVAYCSVSYDGRAFDHEMWMREEILPDLKRLTHMVHKEGAAVSIQLSHCGFFADPSVIGKKPVGSSKKFCTFRMSTCTSMTEDEINEKVEDFVRSAKMSREAGFDAVELHSGHGYLLSQFLSPWTNKRKDRYGGSLENRIRFPAMVIRAVRAALGPGFPIFVKMNQSDGFKGGLQIEEAVEVARSFEREGASALIPSCGFTARTPLFMMRGHVPFREMAANQKSLIRRIGLVLFGKFMVQRYAFKNLFLLDGAQKIQEAVDIPVVYIGGVLSKSDCEQLLKKGFPFMQVGRAIVQNPEFVNSMKDNGEIRSECDHCNRCIAAMDGGGVYCVSEQKGYVK
ncbi:MAG: NADH:flavin oxidoreductase [Spirochaetaceae bacterium]|nr:NADH:flavin oxidoreductase [Spirochaetaceae bacterium]